MTANEAREIVKGMEVSADSLIEIDKILSVYNENDEVPEEVINTVLLIIDKEVDVNKLVGDEDEINSLL
ncbi:MAG TPA: hypothetical protein VN174_03850 [Candidatus Methanoperedens sp.]|nr:hypothetical protein [Candidatus Methanoperedens sp.]